MSMRELRQLTEHADQQHREAMKTIHDDLGEAHLSQQDDAAVANRRNFVRNLGLGGAAVAFGSVLVPVAGLVPAAAGPDRRHGRRHPRRRHGAGEVRPGPRAGRRGGLRRHRRHRQARHRPDRVGPAVRPPPRRARRPPWPSSSPRPTSATDAQRQDPRRCSRPQITAATDANALMQIAFDLETGAAVDLPAGHGRPDQLAGRRRRRRPSSPSRPSTPSCGARPSTCRPTSGCRPSRTRPPPSIPPPTPPAERDPPRSTRHMDVNRDEVRRQLREIDQRGHPRAAPLPRGAEAHLRPRRRASATRPRPACSACRAGASFFTVGGAAVLGSAVHGRLQHAPRRSSSPRPAPPRPPRRSTTTTAPGQRGDRRHPAAHRAVDRGAGGRHLRPGARRRACSPRPASSTRSTLFQDQHQQHADAIAVDDHGHRRRAVRRGQPVPRRSRS